jgi:D-serine deaminase-like pyridoxal phosphate-dependent protein
VRKQVQTFFISRQVRFGAAKLDRLARRIESAAHVEFGGIITYPGHIWLKPGEQADTMSEIDETTCSLEDVLENSLRSNLLK